ncbi:hypothetical protein GOQ27_15120 [Clostridium sp. D2Q-11]|uniref:Uncharacterized protein n=1 Tax=Anaeromonas frigoriresistens TaxID=2683708 RepID=A0A942UV52_9FIRM|nr:hypothetical protein [Anaeromonas frigoriresistens]MBS4539804.1 hypothetical protein [Anaeromonas frigoriresistens]
MYYEILFIEEGIYYINYYPNREDRAMALRMNEKQFYAWSTGKVER